MPEKEGLPLFCLITESLARVPVQPRDDTVPIGRWHGTSVSLASPNEARRVIRAVRWLRADPAQPRHGSEFVS